MKTELFLQSSNQVLSMSKSELSSFAEQFALSMDGLDAIGISATIAKFQHLLGEIEKKVKDQALGDLQKYDGGKSNSHGVEFSIMESGIKYDYSANQVWNDLQDKIEHLRAQQKDIESFCKSLKSATVTVDPETGESFEWFPPAKSSTTTIKKTIK